MTQHLVFPDHDREPQGRYQVWHKEGDGFVHVANADVGNLLAALTLPLMPLGTPETERIAFLVEGTRQTDFGDVIVNPNGAAYQIVNAGYGPAYRPIDFAPSMDQAARNFAANLSPPDAADFWWCQGLTPPWVAEIGMAGGDRSRPKAKDRSVPEQTSARAQAFQDILRNDQPRETETKTRDRGGKEI